MPGEIRFHLDEHVSHDIARALARRGIDVTTSADAKLLSAADDAHLVFAANEHRVIVTQDADYLRHARRDVTHAGIAYCAPGRRSIGEMVRLLCLMHDCLDAEDMVGMIEYL